MDQIARLHPDERDEIFLESANRTGWTPTVVEKDFWVCWTLRRLFGSGDRGPSLIFKGGTSLSKVYGVIRRFSEDIDLAFDRADLGFGGDRDPGAQPSRKKRERELDALKQVTQAYVQGEFADRLRDVITDALGVPEGEDWSSSPDPQDPAGQTLLFQYPRSSATQSQVGTHTSYIRQQLKLELGSRSEQDLAERRNVTPYAAEALPAVFAEETPTFEDLLEQLERVEAEIRELGVAAGGE